MNALDGGSLLPPPGASTTRLDDAVFSVLAGEYGWLSLYAVAKRLPPEQQDEKQVEASLERLLQAGKILLTERHGRPALFRVSPAPGEEPTAEPLRDPAPRVIRYSGPEADVIPPPRPRGKRLTPQHRLSPAKAPSTTQMEDTMRVNKEDVFQQLAKGKQTTAEVAKALKCSSGAAGYHLNALQADKRAHKPDGRMGPWAVLNGHSSPPAQRTRAKPTPDVAELRWSISSDGSVLFRVADTSIDVAGEVLERVIRAREAILAA